MIPIPLARTVLMISSRLSISAAEYDAVGSSRMITLRLNTSPLAISTVFCWPLESRPMIVSGLMSDFRYCSTSTVWRRISRRSRKPPRATSSPMKMFSMTLRLSKTMCSW